MGQKTGGKFHGVYPMLFALFGRDRGLDRKAMKRQLDAMVRAGAHGIAILGLATESNKLSADERRQLLDWVAEDLDGRLPLSATIPGPNAAEQIALARHAKACGAQWLVLQPPPVTGVPEAALGRYFGAIADAVDLPVGLQIAPAYLGNALSGGSALELAGKHGNLNLLKVEMNGYDAARLAGQVGDKFTVFNGQDGVDMPDSLRGGCGGCIPGAEFADHLVKVYDGLSSNKPDRMKAADDSYLALMPILSFLMHSMDRFLVYGKRILCQRLDLPEENASVRAPSAGTDAAGEAIIAHWSKKFGKLEA